MPAITGPTDHDQVNAAIDVWQDEAADAADAILDTLEDAPGSADVAITLAEYAIK